MWCRELKTYEQVTYLKHEAVPRGSDDQATLKGRISLGRLKSALFPSAVYCVFCFLSLERKARDVVSLYARGGVGSYLEGRAHQKPNTCMGRARERPGEHQTPSYRMIDERLSTLRLHVTKRVFSPVGEQHLAGETVGACL